jgi:hypothetical protein
LRRTHLLPVPEVADLDELGRLCAAAEVADDARHIGRRVESVGEVFAAEAAWLHPLPETPFDAAKQFLAKACCQGAGVCGAKLVFARPHAWPAARWWPVMRAACTRAHQTLEPDHYLKDLDAHPRCAGRLV